MQSVLHSVTIQIISEHAQGMSKTKKDNFVCASILVNPKGKVMHIFDHTKHFEYRGGSDGEWFAPIGKNN